MNRISPLPGMTRLWIVAAAINGLLAVALGAYGAHGLSAPAERVAIFRTAVDYQMWHALALLAAAWLRGIAPMRLPDVAGALFLAGILLFAGSLYAIGLTGAAPAPMAAPVGGFMLMAGWAAVAVCGLLRRPAARASAPPE